MLLRGKYMKYCLAVFRSRTAVLAFAEYLSRGVVACKIINTPSEAHIGCGVCVKFSCVNRPYAVEVVRRYGLSGFGGFYLYEKNGNRTSVRKF